MKVYLTSDHGGFELKAKLVEFLKGKNYDVEDLGPDSLDPTDDYPDYVAKGARALLSNHPEKNRLVMACRTGEGEVIAANRFAGIRAVVVWNEAVAKKSREHNNANVLCLSGDYVDTETDLGIVETWLTTPFSGDERHVRRLQKIDNLT